MYNILSLDGGGSWAVLQLLALKERHGDIKGHELLKKYDMVIANSGGSIILTALAEDYRLSEAQDLFDSQTNREMIFHKNSFWDRFFPVDYLRFFCIPFGPKYSAPAKRKAFEKLFKEVAKRSMSEIPGFVGKESLNIIVATYDAYNNRAKFFRSFGVGPDYESVSLTEAAHGSSNAPVMYFDFPARFKEDDSEKNLFFELWDGALGGFNNPVAAGIIEAIRLGVPKDKIRVVSLGTGNQLTTIEAKKEFYRLRDTATQSRRKKYMFWTFGRQLKYFKYSILTQSLTILYQPPDWANFVAYMLLFGENYADKNNIKRFIRLSPLIHSDANTPAESLPLLNDLQKLDMDLTEDKDIAKLYSCFEFWIDNRIVNQPIEFKISRENNLIHLMGHRSFKEGMDDWKAWG